MSTKIFVEAATKAKLDVVIAGNTLSSDSLAFVKEAGKEKLHLNGKDYQVIPSNGKNGQILMSDNGIGAWKDFGLEELMSYGVRWKPNTADPTLERIGNLNLHKSLPIQSGMKGCVYDAVDNKVVYWLNDEDWNLKREGNIVLSVDAFDYLSPIDSLSYVIGEDLIADTCDKIKPGTRVYCSRSSLSDNIKGKVTSIYPTYVDISWDSYDSAYDYIKDEENDGEFFNDLTFTFGSNLTGIEGEVMVYVPEFYIKSKNDGTYNEVRVSTVNIDGTWEHQPAVYISAYAATQLRTSRNEGYFKKLPANSLLSVNNNYTFCRGGTNITSFDNKDKVTSLLNKPATNYTRGDFRECARLGNKELLSYHQYKNIMYWLWVIEYASFYSNAEPEEDLTSEGYHQGGLGAGVSRVTVSKWQTMNLGNPIVPCGITDNLGNGTGHSFLTATGLGTTFRVPRWRGIENPFGDIGIMLDGILVNRASTNSNYIVYASSDSLDYLDSSIYNMNSIGSLPTSQVNYIVEEWNLNNAADIVPNSIRNASTGTYKCAECYVPVGNSNPFIPVAGGQGTKLICSLGTIDYNNPAYVAKGSKIGVRVVHLA